MISAEATMEPRQVDVIIGVGASTYSTADHIEQTCNTLALLPISS